MSFHYVYNFMHDSKNDKEDTRSLVAGLNAAAFDRVLRQYPIYIRAADLGKWRPCREASGTIEGLETLGTLSALCTDGTVAWFRTKEGDVFLGHVTKYSWTLEDGKSGVGAPPQPYSDSKGPAAGGDFSRRPKKNAVQRALDLLLGKKP